MVEIVRAKKLQKIGTKSRMDKNQDGTGSLQTIPVNNNVPSAADPQLSHNLSQGQGLEDEQAQQPLPDTIPNDAETSLDNHTTIDVYVNRPKDYEEVTEEEI